MAGISRGRSDLNRTITTLYDGSTSKDIVVRFSRMVSIQTVGTGSVTWQGTINGTDWSDIQATLLSAGTAATSATVAGIYQIDCSGIDRIRGNSPSGFTSIVAAAVA